MKEFFRGWRRRLGVLTLAMACAFAAGWVRSQSMFDQFCYPTNTWFIELDSLTGLLLWNTTTLVGDTSKAAPNPPTNGHLQVAASKMDSLIPLLQHLFVLGWRFQSEWEISEFAFVVATKENIRMSVLVVPYWSIVIPLTLLSAYLLLVKPRSGAKHGHPCDDSTVKT